ncbi:MAG: hypothetical protein WAN43_06095 [Rhodomicrobium sp.]
MTKADDTASSFDKLRMRSRAAGGSHLMVSLSNHEQHPFSGLPSKKTK